MFIKQTISHMGGAGLAVKSGDKLYYSGNDRLYKEIQNNRY